jgi:predicted metal-dependent hydrolase
MHIDQITRTHRKTILVVITHEGKLIVRAPLRISLAKIEAAVASKAEWIQQKQAQYKNQYPSRPVRNYLPGEKFLYLGKEFSLVIVPNQKNALVFQDGFRLSKRDQIQAPAIFEAWYRQQARQYLTSEVERLASQNDFKCPKIRITGARNRLGSCSSSGHVNFAWRLVMAPPEVIEYVVVHELAHLKVQDHSQKFWGLVGQLLPGFQKHKDWLKKLGYTLAL